MDLPDRDKLFLGDVTSGENSGTLVVLYVWGSCDDILHDIVVGISDIADVLMIS